MLVTNSLDDAIKRFQNAPKIKQFFYISNYKFIASNRVAYDLYRKYKRKDLSNKPIE